MIDAETWLHIRMWQDWRTLRIVSCTGDFLTAPYRVYETISLCEQTYSEATAESESRASSETRTRQEFETWRKTSA